MLSGYLVHNRLGQKIINLTIMRLWVVVDGTIVLSHGISMLGSIFKGLNNPLGILLHNLLFGHLGQIGQSE